MPTLSAESIRLRNQLAGVISSRKATPEHLATLRRDYNASALADYFHNRLSEAPQLTDEQYTVLHDVLNRHQSGGAR